jgi:hypothetical protein
MSGPAWNRVCSAFMDVGQDVRVGRNARCPVPSHGQGHGDKHPSLSITEDERGVALHCHAGDSIEAICAALHLHPADLFNDPPTAPTGLQKQQGNRATLQGAHYVGSASNADARTTSTPEGTTASKVQVGARREHAIEQLLRMDEDGSLGADLPHVEVPPLPDDATEPMKRVARLAQRIVALQLWAGMPDPHAVWFAYRFAAKWVRLPEPTTYTAWRRLREAGWLVLLGEQEPQGRRPRGTFVLGIAGLLPDGAEPVSARVPAAASRVKADDTGRADEAEPVCEDATVTQAEAANGGEVLERDDRLGAAVAVEVRHSEGTSGGGAFGHAGHHNAALLTARPFLCGRCGLRFEADDELAAHLALLHD